MTDSDSLILTVEEVGSCCILHPAWQDVHAVDLCSDMSKAPEGPATASHPCHFTSIYSKKLCCSIAVGWSPLLHLLACRLSPLPLWPMGGVATALAVALTRATMHPAPTGTTTSEMRCSLTPCSQVGCSQQLSAQHSMWSQMLQWHCAAAHAFQCLQEGVLGKGMGVRSVAQCKTAQLAYLPASRGAATAGGRQGRGFRPHAEVKGEEQEPARTVFNVVASKKQCLRS